VISEKICGVHRHLVHRDRADPARADHQNLAHQRLIDQSGATLVHAFADAWVIEGQGTAGIEIAAQMAERGLDGPTRIVCPCGGGGLTAGLALACPDAEIVPVEPEGWDDVRLSLEAGEIIGVPDLRHPTACDALQTPATRPINFAVLKGRVPRGLMVTPAEVRAAQRWAFSKLHLVVEPGGAAALAAVLAGKAATDGRTVVVLSGGNTDPAAFAKVLSGND
jgi:threonine dehydratase